MFVLVGLDVSTLSEEEEFVIIGALPYELLLESQPCSIPCRTPGLLTPPSEASPSAPLDAFFGGMLIIDVVVRGVGACRVNSVEVGVKGEE